MTFRKKLHSRTRADDFRAPVGFVVTQADAEDLVVELNPVDSDETVIRVVDEEGTLLLQEQEFNGESNRLEITMEDLDAGTYYFEVQDSFFHQVKEVRIPPQ
ncbi:MAG: hypothetical protein AAF206_12735 [Bacteroidota bacterium]